MLSQHELVPYLLSRDLIAPQSVVDGNVAVLDSSRRNRNYKIISPDGCYLVKHAVGSSRIQTLSREAAIYQQIFSGNHMDGIAEYLPKFCAYDSERHILVLELIQNAENLREQHQRLRRASSQAAKYAAVTMAALHGAALTPHEWTAASRTSVLSLHQPDLAWYRDASGAALHLVEIIQKHESLTDHLDQLYHEWHASCLIHGDIRAENFLIPVPLAQSKRRVKLVDFEFAGTGDPAWDTGCIFAEYLGFWLFSTPVMAANQVHRFIHLAECPLQNIQPSLRSFWAQYARCMALDGSESEQFVLRAVRFSALRLIVSAFEMSVHLSSLNAYVLCLVQVAMNILAQPEKAAIELFGLALPDGPLCHD